MDSSNLDDPDWRITMNPAALILVGAVAGVGVLHTTVPDHWVPITLMAHQRGWSASETAHVAFKAGIGHVLSTLAIGLVVWIGGVAFATRFGHIVDSVASIALVGFGGWIAIAAQREMRVNAGHGHTHGHVHAHGHSHDFSHLDGGLGSTANDIHGPELKRIETDRGPLDLSIFERRMPPRFRLTCATADSIRIETLRDDGARQMFSMADRGTWWESVEEIPEPHGFTVTVTIDHDGLPHTWSIKFVEHEHGRHGHDHEDVHSHDSEPASDSLYAPMRGGVAVLRHTHFHRHGSGPPLLHLHDNDAECAHPVAAETDEAAPKHVHRHKTSLRTALMLILGSSPMVEGIPVFFAAGRYGVGVIILMAIVFGISTVATYVLLCVYSAAGLRRMKPGAFERYGEVLSGAFIALVGLAFWIWPVL
jgi:nickel/cobalt transporter (NicO) family protein